MIQPADVRKLALSFEDATEEPHFERASFRWKKKIFATLDEQKAIVCVPLSPVDQSGFCAYDAAVMYPVPNAWGKQGWTNINLEKVKKTMLKDALHTAYQFVRSKAEKKKSPAKK